MSFDIHWEKLDRQVAKKVQEILNDHFRKSNSKPSFIGDIEITEFDFGTVPPVVEIVDVTEPLPEFYLPDEEVEEVRLDPGSQLLTADEESEYAYYSSPTPSSQSQSPRQQRKSAFNDFDAGAETPLKQDTDAQIHVSISYQGNLRMTISTELIMNYPSMMFMSLPIRLTVTGVDFSGTAAIAYLRRRVNFCFLEPKDPNESLLKDIHIESEVGDKEKQVLKNVGKIERFIVDQLRKVIDEDFVFPSYHSIELD